MVRGKQVLGRMLVAACAMAITGGITGCSLLTPPLSDAQDTTARQAIDDSLLVRSGTLTVALDTRNAPQVMTGTEGDLQGYAVDLACALANRLGLDVSFVSATSPESPLANGEADLYIGASSDDDAASITIMDGYLENATAVFGAAGDASLTASALADATFAVQGGSATEEVVYSVASPSNVRTCNNVNECFDALAAGEVDYVACDATAGAYLARAQSEVSFCGTLSNVDSYGIAFMSRATELANEVMSAFAQMENDGTIDALRQAWYGDLPADLEGQLIEGVDPAAAADQGLTFESDADDAAAADDASAGDAAAADGPQADADASSTSGSISTGTL